MKKFILVVMLFMTVLVMNAQVAYEKAKTLDNMYLGVSVGATTPLTFNHMFPVNPTFNLKLGKELTPSFGLEIDGTSWFGDNGLQPSKTFFKATNVGLNGVLNLSNILCGYKGYSRCFELKTVTGLGWLHNYGPKGDNLSSKTGLDFCFNLGGGSSINVEPSVIWNLTQDNEVKFDKNYAQLGLSLGYVYHFMCSNGTHNFKLYDIGALNDKINRLQEALAKKPTEKIVEKVVKETTTDKWFIFFAQNSSDLTDGATEVLDQIPEGTTVDIIASASPEGTQAYNQTLSEHRAATVADYLTKKGIKIGSTNGVGVTGETSGRIAVVSIK
jgi:hypothetical protein